MFNKLLLALDLSPDADHLLNRVSKICCDDMEKVHVVHVIKSGMHELYRTPVDWERNLDLRELRDHTVYRLGEILRRNGFSVSAENIYVRAGEPANEIKKLAHELGADLVIVGSHCKKEGWLDLPGATTNCVLQGIDSDVMAVRV
ncbi:MAG: universal stress protein [Pseudohongiellaceae bacterium]